MTDRVLLLRRFSAFLFIVLGLVIVGRGIVEGAPWGFTLMGGLMVALGGYRWRLAAARAARRR